MQHVLNLRTGLRADHRGVAAIEYALIAAAIVVGLVASVPVLEAALSSDFTKIAADFAAIH